MASSGQNDRAAYLSIGIIAWNEEQAIGATLDSLFQQSLFSHLSRRGQRCEIICVANGCTDHTADVAATVFSDNAREHPFRDAFCARVANLAERGKANALNQFVHALSAKEAQFLFLMDADILIHRQDTLWNMVSCLENDPQANVAIDRPCKDLQFKKRKSLRENLSLAMSRLTRSAEAQLCGQLYAIRAEVSRRIFIPRDLTACEDGFVKTLVCTDFLAHEVFPNRIRLADNAEHTFEAYTSPRAIFKNQKRQMIGQTIAHVLVDKYLPGLAPAERDRPEEKLRENEISDPQWLKRLIAEHVGRVRFFWRLYPGLLSHRFKRLGKLSPGRRVLCFPAAAAGTLAALISSLAAHRFLKAGYTSYWPKAERSMQGVECRVSSVATLVGRHQGGSDQYHYFPLTPSFAKPMEGRPALSTPTALTPDPSPIRWERGTEGERGNRRPSPAQSEPHSTL